MKKIALSLSFLLLFSCQPQVSNISNSLENDSIKASSVRKITSIKKPTTKTVKTPVNPASLTKIKIDPNSLFPTEQGYVWNYDVVFHPTDDPYVDYTGTATMEIDKVVKTKNETVINLKAIDTANNELNFPVIKMSDKNVSFEGVTYLGFGSVAASDLKVDFLHLPMKAGEKWDDTLWTVQTMKEEKVTIPSGTYDSWRVDVIGTYDHQYTAVGKYWIVAGIGIVKNELSVPGWTFESVLSSTSKKTVKK